MSLESGRKILSEKRAGMGESPARKRLEKLFDQGTFLELDGLAAKEVVTGFGSVDGAPAYAFAQDLSLIHI